jgi:UDP-N-acetylmuramyl pentapeptide phosphotransferase/UDP-N-acetylglucosamine-1-phosphate transferase
MLNFIFAVISFAIAVALVPTARTFAGRKGLLDIPNERSSHAVPVPRSGGIGIVVGSLAGMASWYVSNGRLLVSQEWILIGALGLGATVGFFDDIFQMPTVLRLPLYLLIAAVISVFFGHVVVVDLPGIPVVSLGVFGGVVFSTLFIAWYTNLFNFMDGIDGIAGGAALVTLGALSIAFSSKELLFLSVIALCASAAVVGFLLYNFPPASVFMGDGGSVFLGLTAGALSLVAVKEGVLSLAASVFLMLPFVFDATFTLIRRILWRERFWQAHRSHVYQQMCDLGFSHRAVTIIYTVAAVIFAAIGLGFDRWPLFVQAVVWWGSLIALLFISIIVVKKNRNNMLQKES